MRSLLLLFLSFMLPIMAEDIAILAGRERPGSAGQKELDWASDKLAELLRSLNIKYKRLPDEALSGAQTEGLKIIFLPQNHILPAASAAALRAFVESGGKLGVFYNSDPQVLSLLGLSKTRYVPLSELGELSGLEFNAQAWLGAPHFMRQGSRNLLLPVEESEKEAACIAWFRRPDGSRSEFPGLLAHANGFYMSHIYLGQDQTAGARFILSFIGGIVPRHWQNAIDNKLASLSNFSSFQSLEELQAWSEQFQTAADNDISKTKELLAQSRLASQEKRYAAAYALLEDAEEQLEEQFLRSCPSRNGELRGAWIHSPYGIADWGWDKTIELLAKNGFNAVFANFLWGYVADYPSEVLPNHPDTYGENGRVDYLQQCLQACQKHQIELHVWKVNWNMGHRTPEELRRKMRVLGRTQQRYNGVDTDYLAPHNEDNFKLELDSMLEIVRKYPVAGIHFDYIRYPDNRADYSFSARIAFEKSLGRPVRHWPEDCRPGGVEEAAFAAWKRENITRLLRAVSKQAKDIRPAIKVSAAVYGDWESARLSVAQDSAAWIDEGLLDFVCPMNYSASLSEFEHLLRKQLLTVAGRIPVYPGLGVYMLPGAAALAEQVMLSRKLGADGFVCFQLNENFARRILPGLRQGVSSLSVTEPLPHQGLSLSFQWRQSQNRLPSPFYSLSEALLCEFELPANLDPKSFRVNLLRDGWDTAPGAKIDLRRESRHSSCRIDLSQPGYYRLELRGENELGLPILYRSDVVKLLSAAEEEELLRQEQPPRFKQSGEPKVAVWLNNSYGGESIFAFLQEQAGLDLAALYNMHAESLAACDIIIIPQPRDQAELFRQEATAERLRAYMRQGGAVLVTHSLCGNRGFINLAPELVSAVPELPLNEAAWLANPAHAIAAGLAAGPFQSAYPFIVSMQASEKAELLASSADGSATLILAGELGRGRYIACGLALGIGRGEVSVELTPNEQSLLLNMLKWLKPN